MLFDENELVLGMISPEKEIVKFCSPVDVNEGEKKGHVEKWLLDIEKIMQQIHHVHRNTK